MSIDNKYADATGFELLINLKAKPANPMERVIVDGVESLVALSHGNSLRAGWYKDRTTGERIKRNIPEMLCLIHSEISEAMEGYRKGLSDDKLPWRPMIEVELADAMLRITDLAGYLGLDLSRAIIEKARFNAERADHKLENRGLPGGKAF